MDYPENDDERFSDQAESREPCTSSSTRRRRRPTTDSEEESRESSLAPEDKKPARVIPARPVVRGGHHVNLENLSTEKRNLYDVAGKELLGNPKGGCRLPTTREEYFDLEETLMNPSRMEGKELTLNAYDAVRATYDVLPGKAVAEADMQKILGSLTCDVCQELINQAIITKNCGHRFCDQCIMISMTRGSTKTCPTCRQNLGSKRDFQQDPRCDELIQQFIPSRSIIPRMMAKNRENERDIYFGRKGYTEGGEIPSHLIYSKENDILKQEPKRIEQKEKRQRWFEELRQKNGTVPKLGSPEHKRRADDNPSDDDIIVDKVYVRSQPDRTSQNSPRTVRKLVELFELPPEQRQSMLDATVEHSDELSDELESSLSSEPSSGKESLSSSDGHSTRPKKLTKKGRRSPKSDSTVTEDSDPSSEDSEDDSHPNNKKGKKGAVKKSSGVNDKSKASKKEKARKSEEKDRKKGGRPKKNKLDDLSVDPTTGDIPTPSEDSLTSTDEEDDDDKNDVYDFVHKEKFNRDPRVENHPDRNKLKNFNFMLNMETQITRKYEREGVPRVIEDDSNEDSDMASSPATPLSPATPQSTDVHMTRQEANTVKEWAQSHLPSSFSPQSPDFNEPMDDLETEPTGNSQVVFDVNTNQTDETHAAMRNEICKWLQTDYFDGRVQEGYLFPRGDLDPPTLRQDPGMWGFDHTFPSDVTVMLPQTFSGYIDFLHQHNAISSETRNNMLHPVPYFSKKQDKTVDVENAGQASEDSDNDSDIALDDLHGMQKKDMLYAKRSAVPNRVYYDNDRSAFPHQLSRSDEKRAKEMRMEEVEELTRKQVAHEEKKIHLRREIVQDAVDAAETRLGIESDSDEDDRQTPVRADTIPRPVTAGDTLIEAMCFDEDAPCSSAQAAERDKIMERARDEQVAIEKSLGWSQHQPSKKATPEDNDSDLEVNVARATKEVTVTVKVADIPSDTENNDYMLSQLVSSTDVGLVRNTLADYVTDEFTKLAAQQLPIADEALSLDFCTRNTDVEFRTLTETGKRVTRNPDDEKLENLVKDFHQTFSKKHARPLGTKPAQNMERKFIERAQVTKYKHCVDSDTLHLKTLRALEKQQVGNWQSALLEPSQLKPEESVEQAALLQNLHNPEFFRQLVTNPRCAVGIQQMQQQGANLQRAQQKAAIKKAKAAEEEAVRKAATEQAHDAPKQAPPPLPRPLSAPANTRISRPPIRQRPKSESPSNCLVRLTSVSSEKDGTVDNILYKRYPSPSSPNWDECVSPGYSPDSSRHSFADDSVSCLTYSRFSTREMPTDDSDDGGLDAILAGNISHVVDTTIHDDFDMRDDDQSPFRYEDITEDEDIDEEHDEEIEHDQADAFNTTEDAVNTEEVAEHNATHLLENTIDLEREESFVSNMEERNRVLEECREHELRQEKISYIKRYHPDRLEAFLEEHNRKVLLKQMKTEVEHGEQDEKIVEETGEPTTAENPDENQQEMEQDMAAMALRVLREQRCEDSSETEDEEGNDMEDEVFLGSHKVPYKRRELPERAALFTPHISEKIHNEYQEMKLRKERTTLRQKIRARKMANIRVSVPQRPPPPQFVVPLPPNRAPKAAQRATPAPPKPKKPKLSNVNTPTKITAVPNVAAGYQQQAPPTTLHQMAQQQHLQMQQQRAAMQQQMAHQMQQQRLLHDMAQAPQSTPIRPGPPVQQQPTAAGQHVPAGHLQAQMAHREAMMRQGIVLPDPARQPPTGAAAPMPPGHVQGQMAYREALIRQGMLPVHVQHGQQPPPMGMQQHPQPQQLTPAQIEERNQMQEQNLVIQILQSRGQLQVPVVNPPLLSVHYNQALAEARALLAQRNQEQRQREAEHQKEMMERAQADSRREAQARQKALEEARARSAAEARAKEQERVRQEQERARQAAQTAQAMQMARLQAAQVQAVEQARAQAAQAQAAQLAQMQANQAPPGHPNMHGLEAYYAAQLKLQQQQTQQFQQHQAAPPPAGGVQGYPAGYPMMPGMTAVPAMYVQPGAPQNLQLAQMQLAAQQQQQQEALSMLQMQLQQANQMPGANIQSDLQTQMWIMQQQARQNLAAANLHAAQQTVLQAVTQTVLRASPLAAASPQQLNTVQQTIPAPITPAPILQPAQPLGQVHPDAGTVDTAKEQVEFECWPTNGYAAKKRMQNVQPVFSRTDAGSTLYHVAALINRLSNEDNDLGSFWAFRLEDQVLHRFHPHSSLAEMKKFVGNQQHLIIFYDDVTAGDTVQAPNYIIHESYLASKRQ